MPITTKKNAAYSADVAEWLKSIGVYGDASVYVKVSGAYQAVGNSIGGIAIGTVGAAGTAYEGFTLAGGEDFTASLSSELIRPGNPYGKIANNFSERDRRRTSATSVGFMADQYSSGWRDANDGIYVSSWSDVLTQSGSVLTCKVRKNTTQERAIAGVRTTSVGPAYTYRPMAWAHPTLLASFAETGSRITEFRFRYTMPSGMAYTSDGNPAMAIWALDVRGGSEAGSTPGSGNFNNEFDLTEDHYSGGQINSRYASGLNNTQVQPTRYGEWERRRLTWSASTIKVEQLDDAGNVLDTKTVTNSSTNQARLYYWMFGVFNTTNNTVDSASFDESEWTGKESTLEVDWVRTWTPNGTALVPLLADATPVVLEYQGTGSYVIPSQASLWGGAVDAEYIAWANGTDTNGPGRTDDLTSPAETGRDALPPGATYNAGTRTLSFDATFSAQSGVIHGYVYPSKASVGFVRPHKFAIYVKPKIALPTLMAAVPGSPYTYQIPRGARNWDNGNLPNGVNSGLTLVSGPAWLNFDAATYTLSVVGNVPSHSGTMLTFRCTNAVGLYTEETVELPNAASGYPYEFWTGPGWFDASDASSITLSGSNVTSITNKRAGSGNLTVSAPVASEVAYVTAAQNGRNAIRLTRDVSSSTNAPRAAATSTDAISTMWQGDDKPYTVLIAYKPTDTNTGYLFSASDTVDITNSQIIGLIRRNASASSVRRQLVNATPNDVSWGSGQAQDSLHIVALKFTGTALSVWDTSLTKSQNAAAQNTNAFNSELVFRLFTAEINGSVDPTFASTQCSLDFYEMVVENTAKDDADIQQAITDLATKWGITLS